MEWLAENWLWVLVGVAFIAFHVLGHGRHGKRDERGKPPTRPH